MKRHIQTVAVLGALLAPSAQAQIAGQQFSADMISRKPDGQSMAGKMYVGDGRIRLESTQDGQALIRITDQKQGMEWLLFPDRKTFMEHRVGPAGGAEAAKLAPSAETDPCTGLQGLTCRRVGEEDVAGRTAVKWEMSVSRDGETLTGAQWIDVQRGLPLKYQMPNGQSMELKMVGTETIGGRGVEKWQMTSVAPNQAPVQTFQWYDPDLKLSIREEFGGGFVRELTNIQVGAQPDQLFSVPEGYSRMEQPPAPK